MPYMIDGHNLIGAHPGISLDDPEDELQLVQALQAFAGRKGRSIWVYFDGADPASPKSLRAGRVQARFVTPPRTADDAICAHLRRLKGEASNWTVVSSDREVSQIARQVGARVLSSQEFIQRLAEAYDEQPEEKPAANLTAEELETWQRIFRTRDGDEGT